MKLFTLILLTAGVLNAPAQEPVNTGSIQDIYNHIAGVLAKTQSVDFRGIHRCTMTEIYGPYHHQPPGSAPRNLDADIHFQGRGDKYRFTETYVSDPPPSDPHLNAKRSNDLAWDGKYYQVLNHQMNEYLLISQRNPDHNHLRLGSYSALNMFGFLTSQVPAGDPTISWDVAKNPAAWKNCLAGARLVGPARFHEKPCSVVTISNAVYRPLKIPRCSYTVYFSWSDGMFPVAWKIEDEYHRVLEDYEIEELGQAEVEGSIFYYPKRAKGAWYPDRDFPSGEPHTTYTSEYSFFSLNTITDDKLFTIDRTEVSEIYDYDRGICTAVRK